MAESLVIAMNFLSAPFTAATLGSVIVNVASSLLYDGGKWSCKSLGKLLPLPSLVVNHDLLRTLRKAECRVLIAACDEALRDDFDLRLDAGPIAERIKTALRGRQDPDIALLCRLRRAFSATYEHVATLSHEDLARLHGAEITDIPGLVRAAAECFEQPSEDALRAETVARQLVEVDRSVAKLRAVQGRPLAPAGLPERVRRRLERHPGGWWDLLRVAFREELKDPANEKAWKAWQMDVLSALPELGERSAEERAEMFTHLERLDEKLNATWSDLGQLRVTLGDALGKLDDVLSKLDEVGEGLAQFRDVLDEVNSGVKALRSNARPVGLIDYGPFLSRYRLGVARDWMDAAVDAFVGAVARRDPNAPQYLSLVADPYFGKTWLAVSQALRPAVGGHPAVYHFFRRNEGVLDDPEAARRSLAAQLRIAHDIQSPTFIANAGEDLLDALRATSKKLAVGAAQLIIIDGIDECFGRSGDRRPAEVAGFLPDPNTLQTLPGIAILIASRTRLTLPWADNPGKCAQLELPDREALVAEVADLLPQLNDRLATPAPTALLDHFARASEGLLGLASDVYLRASAHTWAQWEEDPATIPHGLLGALSELWGELSARAESRIDRRTGRSTFRTVLAILSLARSPLSKRQLDAILEEAASNAGVRRPRSVPDPASIPDGDVIAALDLAAELFEKSLLSPATGDAPRHHFAHSLVGELIAGEVEAPNARSLPGPEELEYWRKVFRVTCEAAWRSPTHPLHGFAVRHLHEYLRALNDDVALHALATDQAFLEAQLNAFPDEPTLSFELLRAAFDAAIAAQPANVLNAVELALEYGLRSESISALSPIDSLARFGIARTLSSLKMQPNAENRVVGMLMLAQRLFRDGRQDDAAHVLAQLGEPRALDGWQHEAAGVLCAELLPVFTEPLIVLAHLTMSNEQRREGIRALASSGNWQAASELIAHDSLPGATLADTAADLAATIPLETLRSFSDSLEDKRWEWDILINLGAHYVSQGRIEELWSWLQGMNGEWDRAQSLRGLAPVLLAAGQFDRALAFTQTIVEDSARLQALYGLIQAVSDATQLRRLLDLVKRPPRSAAQDDVSQVSAVVHAQLGELASMRVAIESVDSMKSRCRAIEACVAHLGPTAWKPLADIVAAMPASPWRAEALAAIAPLGVDHALPEVLALAASLHATPASKTTDAALADLARTLADAGAYDSAQACAEQIDSKSINRSEALSATAQALARSGEIDRALQLVHSYSATGREHCYADLAQLLFEAGRLDTVHENFLKNGVGPGALARIASVYGRANRLDDLAHLVSLIHKTKHRARAIGSIAPAFAQTDQLDALRTLIEGIDDLYDRPDAVAAVVPFFAAAGVLHTLSPLLISATDTLDRIAALSLTCEMFCATDRLDSALLLAEAIPEDDPRARFDALANVVYGLLNAHRLDEALAVQARHPTGLEPRVYAVLGKALIAADRVDTLWETVSAIPEPMQRAHALEAITPELVRIGREDIWHAIYDEFGETVTPQVGEALDDAWASYLLAMQAQGCVDLVDLLDLVETFLADAVSRSARSRVLQAFSHALGAAGRFELLRDLASGNQADWALIVPIFQSAGRLDMLQSACDAMEDGPARTAHATALAPVLGVQGLDWIASMIDTALTLEQEGTRDYWADSMLAKLILSAAPIYCEARRVGDLVDAVSAVPDETERARLIGHITPVLVNAGKVDAVIDLVRGLEQQHYWEHRSEAVSLAAPWLVRTNVLDALSHMIDSLAPHPALNLRTATTLLAEIAPAFWKANRQGQVLDWIAHLYEEHDHRDVFSQIGIKLLVASEDDEGIGLLGKSMVALHKESQRQGPSFWKSNRYDSDILCRILFGLAWDAFKSENFDGAISFLANIDTYSCPIDLEAHTLALTRSCVRAGHFTTLLSSAKDRKRLAERLRADWPEEAGVAALQAIGIAMESASWTLSWLPALAKAFPDQISAALSVVDAKLRSSHWLQRGLTTV